MCLALALLPDGNIRQYKLLNIAQDGYVYLELPKGMYGLPQAGILTSKRLTKHLATFGYVPTAQTSKTKGKEAEERVRQGNGETPTKPELANWFKGNIDHPNGIVLSTHSGSMTQEIFFLFAEHFTRSLPQGLGPIILLLDGPGSRRPVPALQLLMTNKIYPLFIVIHTPIWAQPHDAGVN
jgi:hypothetical protein